MSNSCGFEAKETIIKNKQTDAERDVAEYITRMAESMNRSEDQVKQLAIVKNYAKEHGVTL